MPETTTATIGEICKNDPCYSPIRCQFCRVIHEIHNNLLSENLLNGSGEESGDPSILGKEDELKNNKHWNCKYVC